MNRHCWRGKNELLNSVLLRTLTQRQSSVDRPATSYIHQLSVDSGCCGEDLPRTMTDRDGWRESRESLLSERLDNDDLFHAKI